MNNDKKRNFEDIIGPWILVLLGFWAISGLWTHPDPEILSQIVKICVRIGIGSMVGYLIMRVLAKR